MTEQPDRPDAGGPDTGGDLGPDAGPDATPGSVPGSPPDTAPGSPPDTAPGTGGEHTEDAPNGLEAAGRLRRDPSPSESAEAIKAFWSWWREFGDLATALLGSGDAGDLERLEAEISPRVEAIHPELSWELFASAGGRHALSLSGGGRPALRALTERWARAGGGPTDRFEFHPANQARPELLVQKLRLNDHELDLSHLAFGVRFDGRRARFDVSVYHPDFLFISEEEQLEFAQTAMRFMLGEDEAARWVGHLLPAAEKPIDALPADQVRVVVKDISAQYADPRWAEVSGKTPDGRPLTGLARFPLRRVDFPLYEVHIALAVPYKQRSKDGLPGKRAQAALRGFEEVLVSALGEDGILAAHISGDGSRVFHLYVDPGSAAGDRIADVAREWDQGKARVQTTSDPDWNDIQPFVA